MVGNHQIIPQKEYSVATGWICKSTHHTFRITRMLTHCATDITWNLGFWLGCLELFYTWCGPVAHIPGVICCLHPYILFCYPSLCGYLYGVLFGCASLGSFHSSHDTVFMVVLAAVAVAETSENNSIVMD